MTDPAPGQPPTDSSLGRIVAELCALHGLQLGPGDVEAVAAIYAEYLRFIDTILAAPLAPEAQPPLHLEIGQPPGASLPGRG